jgi:hypothetical protein
MSQRIKKMSENDSKNGTALLAGLEFYLVTFVQQMRKAAQTTNVFGVFFQFLSYDQYPLRIKDQGLRPRYVSFCGNTKIIRQADQAF